MSKKSQNPNSKKAEDMLTKAKVTYILSDPFVATIMLSLKWIEDSSIPTASTNGIELRYNPDFITSLRQTQVEFVLAHEVWHIALMHPFRLEGREPKRANYAMDYAVNEMLHKAGMDISFAEESGFLLDKKFFDLSFEEIYRRIKPPPTQYINLGEVTVAVDSNTGEPLTDGQLKEIEEKVNRTVKKAIQTAKDQGKVPGGLKNWMQDFNEPKVSWQEKLRAWFVAKTYDRWTWTRPSRRYVQHGVYLPTMDGRKLGEVVVMIDTSGSVSEDELKQFGGEISSMIEDAGADVLVLYVDTKVANVEEFKRADLPLKLGMHGGGGTDFRPGFKWLKDHDKTPMCVVYFTDLWCNSFPDEPSYPVLWAVHRQDVKQVPFGEIVVIEDY